MNRIALNVLAASALASAASLSLVTPAQAGDVSVAVNVAVPGLYGQVTIGGDVPAPQLIMPRAVVAVPTRVVVAGPPPEPLYLHVPPGHEKHWAQHCREYNACGRPVYFVSERWYHDVYRPHREAHADDYRRMEERRDDHERHEHHDDHDHGHDHDHDHGHGHDHD